jgi:hypothetical protein
MTPSTAVRRPHPGGTCEMSRRPLLALPRRTGLRRRSEACAPDEGRESRLTEISLPLRAICGSDGPPTRDACPSSCAGVSGTERRRSLLARTGSAAQQGSDYVYTGANARAGRKFPGVVPRISLAISSTSRSTGTGSWARSSVRTRRILSELTIAYSPPPTSGPAA